MAEADKEIDELKVKLNKLEQMVAKLSFMYREIKYKIDSGRICGVKIPTQEDCESAAMYYIDTRHPTDDK